MEKEKKKNNSTKILVGVILVLVIAVVILVVTRPKTNAIPAALQDAFSKVESSTLTTVELSKMTEQVGELITQKYYYKDIHEDKKEKDGIFDSEELTLIVYEGVIYAGIDLKEVDYEINNEAKKIMVHLPAIKIISHNFDDDNIQSYDVKKKIFSKGLSYEDSAKKFDELKKLKEEAVMKDEEFLSSVRADTEKTLTNFFHVSDSTKDYTIEFTHAKS
ncbi:MAG: DUF4230 domain-containing protein [Oscillospiraceae bacterium]|nr:DUF4230 domain-containing protein [Oscillospiraceae bacterium]